jgi:D-ribulokinase
MTNDLVIGVDVGTQGVRLLLVDAAGAVVARARSAIPLAAGAAGAVFEQHPQQWWQAAVEGLRQIGAAVGGDLSRVRGVSVTATSGTVALLDAQGQPVRPAIMYSDWRAQEEAAWLNEVGAAVTARLGYRFDASFGLPKFVWLQRHEPAQFARTRFCIHAGDMMSGRLTGDYGVSDWSQALKSGYDVIEQRWPPFIHERVGLPVDCLPRIVAPGSIIGAVTPEAAAHTGLPAGVPVVAGMTDSCAAQIAGGAVEPGQWLSVLGTTLALKGVTRDLLPDPQGRIYSHRHPDGMWLPGSASNTGGEVLARRFADADLAALDQHAAQLTPSGLVCYPLERVGERFPFACDHARGFLVGHADTPERHYTACLEGVGYVERMAYERVQRLGAPVAGAVRVAGGGARSRVWLQIRASILNRMLAVPTETEAAFGAAVLAAGATLYPGVVAATRAMVHRQAEVEPQAALVGRYTEGYEQFVAECRARGYGP